MTSTKYMRGQAVTVLESAGRGQVWIETSTGITLRVHEAGLTDSLPRKMAAARLTVDPRGTDGAR